MFGGILLVGIGIMYFRKPAQAPNLQKDDSSVHSDFSSTLLLTLTNPTTVLSFVAVLAGLGMGGQRAWWLTFLLVGGIFLGSMLWWVILVLLVNRFRDRFDQASHVLDEPDRRPRYRRLRRCNISDWPQARTLATKRRNMARPLVLIHGYSAEGKDFQNLKQALVSRGIDSKDIDICNYISLNNEVTIKDIAEGLDRAFRMHEVFGNETQEFDAIVHSTGMLVLRAWLANAGRPATQSAAPAPQAPDRSGAGHVGFAAGAQGPHLARRHGERQSPPRPRFPERRRPRTGRPRTGQQVHLGPGASRPAGARAVLRQRARHAPTSPSSSATTPYDGVASVANDPGYRRHRALVGLQPQYPQDHHRPDAHSRGQPEPSHHHPVGRSTAWTFP